MIGITSSNESILETCCVRGDLRRHITKIKVSSELPAAHSRSLLESYASFGYMHKPEYIPLTSDTCKALCHHLEQRTDLFLTFVPEQHAIQIGNAEFNKGCTLRLPFDFPLFAASETLNTYLKQLHQAPKHLILLLQAGHCALGFVTEGELQEHKVIKKYMTRAKQGKSQLTHLKTKGKSRAGSRIRLRQSDAFFEEINTKINQWQVIDQASHLLYNAPVRLWPLLFETDEPIAFASDDSRIRKIPRDINTPGYDELVRVANSTHYGMLTTHQAMDLSGIEDFLP